MCKKGVPTKLKLFHETYLINLNPEENRIEEMEEIKENAQRRTQIFVQKSSNFKSGH